MTRNQRLAVVAATLSGMLALAACGTSSSDDGSEDKAPIKLMVTGPLESSIVSLPSIEVGGRVAVDQINASGGINGHKIELIACNDKGDPNAAIACARRAIKEHVVALVGGFSGFEPQIVPLLERAGIPWVGNTAVQNSTSRIYYMLGGEGAALAFAMAIYLSDPAQGCTKISAVAENAPSSKAAVQLFQTGVTTAGGTNGKPAYGAETTADWGPVVAGAIDDGSNCLAVLGSPQNTPKIITAINQSGDAVKTVVPQSLLPDQAVAAMGKAADGVILTSGYLPYTADAPAVQELVKRAKKLNSDVPLDGVLESTYASVLVVAEAAKALDQITAETLTEALGKLKGFDTGLGPVVDFTATNPTKLFSRILNTKVFLLKAEGGKTVLEQPQPLDTMPAFTALGQAGQ